MSRLPLWFAFNLVVTMFFRGESGEGTAIFVLMDLFPKNYVGPDFVFVLMVSGGGDTWHSI